jgi:hypothetical protein
MDYCDSPPITMTQSSDKKDSGESSEDHNSNPNHTFVASLYDESFKERNHEIKCIEVNLAKFNNFTKFPKYYDYFK